MILGVYSVLDEAVNAFLQPFYARSDGEAIRSFSDACVDVKHQFAMHPSDYTLFRIGSFNDANGELATSHARLGSALQFVVTADLSQATGATIESLRAAVARQ